MITRIRLSNWRAYGNVVIHLEPGTTFLIGMNGVGKSSLIEAVRWAFDRTAKPDAEFIRKGERSAFVEVDLQVEQAVLRINREVSLGTGPRPLKTPKSELTATVDDRVVTEAELFARLETAWGADIGFVTRTAFLDDLASASKDSELRAHLSRAYALDTLEEHVGVFEQAVKQAGVVAGEEHAAAEQLEREIARRRREVEEQETLLHASDARAGDLDAALEAATVALADAQRAQAALDARAAWDAAWQQLVEATEGLVGEPSPGTDLRPLLRTALEAASRQRDEAREVNARLRERMAALEEALATLDAAAQECPVCRRPLDEESRAHAHEVQDADRAQTGRELDEVDIDGPSTVVARLQRLLRAADRLGDPPAVPLDASPDVDAARTAVGEAGAHRDELLRERGVTIGRLEAARRELARLEGEAEAASAASAAFRRLAVLTAARDALRNTVTEVLDTQLEPIGREVSARWDGVFPDRPGLSVDPDGNIRRTVADGVLEYASFSAGEKTVARLLVKLATLITTTYVPFCFIDEPLEHLDEKSRLIIARTLAQFGRAKVLEQVFVTTYEQSLADMVGRSSDEPHVEYLGTSQVAAP